MRGTALGLLIEAIGSNPRGERDWPASARTPDDRLRLCLLRPLRRRWPASSRLPTSRARTPTMPACGSSWTPILAVVIGGTSLFGGRFSLVLAA